MSLRETRSAVRHRIPANKSLELEIEDILFRPPGRPSRKPLVRYKSFRYQAESWSRARRIVAQVEHHQGELFPRVGFIVTSLRMPSRSVVRFYNKRGTAEQWIKEGKQATHWTRLACHRFRANEVRLQLSVLAYNLGNLWRRLGLRTGSGRQMKTGNYGCVPGTESSGPACARRVTLGTERQGSERCRQSGRWRCRNALTGPDLKADRRRKQDRT